MIGVYVPASDAKEQIELIQQLDVAINPFQYGIDDEGLATPTTGQQITVGGRHIVEHLGQNHFGTSEFAERFAGLLHF